MKQQSHMRVKEQELQLDELKDNIKNMIMKQRAKQFKKILVMKKLHDRKKRGAQDEI